MCTTDIINIKCCETHHSAWKFIDIQPSPLRKLIIVFFPSRKGKRSGSFLRVFSQLKGSAHGTMFHFRRTLRWAIIGFHKAIAPAWHPTQVAV